MVCIYCGGKTQIINSRDQKKTHQTWRRHRCLYCKSLFTTHESVSYQDSIRVVKRSGSIEPFYNEKLLFSIYQAVSHLANPAIKAGHLTNTVLQKLFDDKPSAPELPSSAIGLTASRVLKNFDAAASVRYLSYQTKLQSPLDIKKSLK